MGRALARRGPAGQVGMACRGSSEALDRQDGLGSERNELGSRVGPDWIGQRRQGGLDWSAWNPGRGSGGFGLARQEGVKG